MTPCGALRASSPSATTEPTSGIWTSLLFGDAFCTNTYLLPDDVMHRSLYTEQRLRAGILTQRGLRTEKLLCTDTFTHRGFYTKKKIFTYRCFIQRCFCAHKQRHVGIFTHRSFATEKPLHRTVFTLRFFGTEKNRHRENSPRRLHQKKHTDFFHAATLPRTVFTQQKLFRTETFTGRFF